MTETCAAIDLGASSGRVIVAELDDGRITLNEVHRFETPLVTTEAGLCWDIDVIIEQVARGVAAADRRTRLDSVGADTWAVDYVLLGEDGRRAAPVVAYRDRRTCGVMEDLLTRLPARTIYEKTGIQFLSFNTLYQLAACARQTPEWFVGARHLLMIPDYIHYRLSGQMVAERTNATTTQCFNLALDDWDPELLAAAGAPRRLFRHPVEPGTVVGSMVSPSGRKDPIAVIAPATHDTASAVVAAPLEGPDDAYISSGTWSLMGVESPRPFNGEDARALNLSNEGGFGRRYRVLKNIMGLWLFERIRKELGGVDRGVLIAEASAATGWRSVVNPQDERFLNPDSMVAAICAFCAETGQRVPEERGAIVRCVFDSLALSYRQGKEDLEAIRGRKLARIRIVGGGSCNGLLNQLCADACGIPVSAGPVETTALGNACVQMIARGALSGLDAARAVIRRSFPLADYVPRTPVPPEAWARFYAFQRR